jgi:hypothetical protein
MHLFSLLPPARAGASTKGGQKEASRAPLSAAALFVSQRKISAVTLLSIFPFNGDFWHGGPHFSAVEQLPLLPSCFFRSMTSLKKFFGGPSEALFVVVL